jgi:NADH-quinone oxidoreductase subunit G
LVLVTFFRPQVRHTVTGTLALLRSNHPEDCMSCDVNGKCEFQDLINRYQVRVQGLGLGF